MPDSFAHLTEPWLELAAEDRLPPGDSAAHLERCARCAAEVDERRTMFATLSALPRFAPSPAFSEAVMSRVRFAQAPAAAALRRWLPATRRGWMGLAAALLAPLVPLIAGLAWLLARPMVSVSTLWSWGAERLHDAAWAVGLRLADAAIRAGALDGAARVADGLAALSGEAGVAALAGAALIPASAWLLVRLSRTPIARAPYAH